MKMFQDAPPRGAFLYQNRTLSKMHLILILNCVIGSHVLGLATPPAIIKVTSTKEGHISRTFSLQPSNHNTTSSGIIPKQKFNLSFDKRIGRPLDRIKSAFRSTFLPSSYPAKIPRGYLPYCIWSAVQDLSTNLRGVIATQRVLEGVGVGREGATALSASINFIIRDGAGMAASLFFTALASRGFRSDIKRWRIFADLIVDVGITLEVMATVVPKSLFLFMICVGNMCKAMCGVASGACGGAINLHWAKGSDISEVNAKFSSQNTVTGSLGLVFAAIFASSVSSVSHFTLWNLFAGLTVLHIYANVQCMKLISFDGPNTLRMNMIVSTFLTRWMNTVRTVDVAYNGIASEPSTTSEPLEIDDPVSIAKTEPLFFFWKPKTRPEYPIRIGLSFDDFVRYSTKPVSSIQSMLAESKEDGHVITVGFQKRGKGRCILVALKENITPTLEAKALFHALFLCRILEESGIDSNQNLKSIPSVADNVDAVVSEAERVAKKSYEDAWEAFMNSASVAGWDISKSDLRTEGFGISVIEEHQI